MIITKKEETPTRTKRLLRF